MNLYGFFCDAELLTDLFIAETVSDQSCNIAFTNGQCSQEIKAFFVFSKVERRFQSLVTAVSTLSNSRSSLIGLVRKSRAPRLKAITAVPTSAKAVINMMGSGHSVSLSLL